MTRQQQPIYHVTWEEIIKLRDADSTHVCNGSKKKGCSGCHYDNPLDEESLEGTRIVRRCDLYGFKIILLPIAAIREREQQ